MPTLIQISDCHIDDKTKAIGVDTQKNLNNVVKRLIQIPADLLVISGDVSHHGSISSYTIVKNILSVVKIPLLMFAGNHDNKENLQGVFSKNINERQQIGDWAIHTIDSVKKNHTSGFVSKQALEQLNHALQNCQAKFQILVLHHPIVSMQSSWDDALSLENPQDLFNVIDKYPKIKAILWGHAHEAKSFIRKGVHLVSCPSTAVQFNEQDKIGFNIYQLKDNGKIEFKTQWL